MSLCRRSGHRAGVLPGKNRSKDQILAIFPQKGGWSWHAVADRAADSTPDYCPGWTRNETGRHFTPLVHLSRRPMFRTPGRTGRSTTLRGVIRYALPPGAASATIAA